MIIEITQKQVMTFIIIWLAFITISQIYLIYMVQGTPFQVLNITTTTEPSTTTILKVNYPTVKCNITHATLYYLSTCPHCHQQLSDGTYDSLVRSGVNVELIDVSSGNYNVTYIPDWRINGVDNYGYQTWDQLKVLFQCR